MIVHETQIRVRYGEVDRMGFLYHSHYVEFFDVGRSELMRSIGLTNFEVERSGVELPVRSVNVEYKNPAFYDDLITVRTVLKQMPRATIVFDYEVYRNGSGDELGERQIVATGCVTLAFMGRETKRACRPPQNIIDAVKSYF